MNASTEIETTAASVLTQLPDEFGHFGPYGGKFVAETLMAPLAELEAAYRECLADPAFIAEFLASDAAFVHPLKIATGDEAILRLLRDAEACAG